MQLGSCYRNSKGSNDFAKRYLIGTSSYDPKDIRYSRWRLSYNGHNRTHVWLRMMCTAGEVHCNAANIAPYCTNQTQCILFETKFYPQNIYFYAGSELKTKIYPTSISLRITDDMGKEHYSSNLLRRIYSQGRSPRLAVYKNEQMRLMRGHLEPGFLVEISHPLNDAVHQNVSLQSLLSLEDDAQQMLYSFMTPNYDSMTHFWCPVGNVFNPPV